MALLAVKVVVAVRAVADKLIGHENYAAADVALLTEDHVVVASFEV